MSLAEDFRPPPRGPEFPDPDMLRAYGDAMFLVLRSDHHSKMRVANMREAIEPPLVLGQYQIFRFDDVPRAMLTWARLGRSAERRYVQGGPLLPEDWNSGDRVWLIDMIAPYPGLSQGLGRWLMQPGKFSHGEFWFRRVLDGSKTRRIVHVDVNTPGKTKVMSEAAFLAL